MFLDTPPKFTEPPWTLIAAGTTLAGGSFIRGGLTGAWEGGTAAYVYTTEEAANTYPYSDHRPVRFDSLTQFADALRALEAAGVTHVLINPPSPPNRESEHLPYSLPAVLASLGV